MGQSREMVADGKVADARAGCGEDRVRNRGGNRRHAGLASPAERRAAFVEVHLDVGAVGELRHRVVREIRLRDGTFSVLCEIVRDLTARGRIKPLNEADSAALRRARSSLLQEWAAAAEVTLAEATAEVDELLQAGTH